MHTLSSSSPAFQPLQGFRILSLALNLPGPAALMRCHAMGAQCSKLEPIAPDGSLTADPMHAYSLEAYEQLHQGIERLQANLKTDAGQRLLHKQLTKTDVLLTSFRPSALDNLGLSWESLQSQHSRLCMVRIFGSTEAHAADHAGHDLTYQAQAGLVDSGHLPASLFADMAGAVMASEAILQTLLARAHSGAGHCIDIGLEQAAEWLALPRQWQMTTPDGDVGGAHAGYGMYRCKDGWVALAALEPHFAQRLCNTVGLPDTDGSTHSMRNPSVHQAVQNFLLRHTCEELAAMAKQSDLPLHLAPAKHK